MDDPIKSTSSGRKKGSRRRARRRLLWIGLIALVVVAALAVGSWSSIKVLRQNRTLKRAQEHLEKKDYIQAAMSAGYALQLNPKDVEATRIMAEVTAANGERQELIWRSRLVDLQPQAFEHRVAWANAALRYRETNTAEQALAGATEAQKKSAAYHAVAAKLAAALRQRGAAEASVAETVRLDPGNELYQLELASLRLGSTDEAKRDLAREEIERLAASAKVSRPALYVLIRDAMLRGDGPRALNFAATLNASGGANFQDRMQYLRLLRTLNRREFWWCLAQLQEEVIGQEGQLPGLMTYLNKSGLPKVTIEWARRLPEEARNRQLVPVALAEACTMLGDWEGLKTHVKFAGWGSLEFQRLALLARVAREQGDLPGAGAQWKAATAAAGGRPDDLATLARLATTWKWTDEANSVLWLLARGSTAQMAALQSLSRNYQIAGDTRELLNVANRMLEIDARSAEVKNNIAYLSLLLDAEKERAHALAKEVYQSDPANPAFVSTYALALHLLGKSGEGLKLMQALPQKDREFPANAFAYGVLLAAGNQRDEATRHLNLAETSSLLLPQEKALLAKAREWVAKP